MSRKKKKWIRALLAELEHPLPLPPLPPGTRLLTDADFEDVDTYVQKERHSEGSSRKLLWRILPPGTHPFPKIIEHFQQLQKNQGRIIYDLDRLHKLKSLHPDEIYIGEEEYEGYVVFYFRNLRKAVLECPLVGNAIYVITGDWKILSRYTKSKLLQQHANEVQRIIHNGNWFSMLKNVLELDI